MRERPRGKYERENGATLLAIAHAGDEYPEVEQWDREYADECDRLSEQLATKRKAQGRCWGRWFEDDGFLVTYIARPPIDGAGFSRPDNYDIYLGRLSEDWEGHMRGKTWLGSRGLADLCRALLALRGEREVVGALK